MDFKSPNTTPIIKDESITLKKILLIIDQQSETSKNQYKTSKNLVIVTIIIMIVQIGYSVWTNSESKNRQSSLTKIIETQSTQSELISRMSLNLLYLENQVNELKKKNDSLKMLTKKNYVP